MTFFRQVVHDHLTEVLELYKADKLTTDAVIKKIIKASDYIANNERYEAKKAAKNKVKKDEKTTSNKKDS